VAAEEKTVRAAEYEQRVFPKTTLLQLGH